MRDEEFKDQLINFRKEIDVFDKKIMNLLNDRRNIVEQIAHFKDENKLTIFQIERWFEILKEKAGQQHNPHVSALNYNSTLYYSTVARLQQIFPDEADYHESFSRLSNSFQMKSIIANHLQRSSKSF